MKLKNVFKKIKKPVLHDWERIDLDALMEELGLDMMQYDFHGIASATRLAGYWLKYWNCTDTQVGSRLYFLDDKPCAMTEQLYRKSPVKWKWVSKNMFLEVKAFIESFRNVEEFSPELLDLNSDIPETYKLRYKESLYTGRKIAYLEGKRVGILGIGDVPDNLVTVRHGDGTDQTVELIRLDFPLELDGEADEAM